MSKFDIQCKAVMHPALHLTLPLPESIMETCNALLTFESVTKSCGVAI